MLKVEMLGPIILSALALTGASAPLWVSDAEPRAGAPYVAMSCSGSGRVECSGSIGRAGAKATLYQLTEPRVSVCVFAIPKNAAGKTLAFTFSVTESSEPVLSYVDGRPVWTATVTHLDGLAQRRLIRR